MIKSNNFPILETERFVLKQCSKNDLENVYKGLSNPEVIKYYGISFDSLEATNEQIEWFAQLEKEQTGQWWVVWSKKENQFCGAGGFNDWQKENNKAELGFWLLPEFWGQGIMREVLPKIIEYGFESMKLHRIEGFVDVRNRNCKKNIEKLGFKLEGTMQDCEVKDGEYISLDIYASINTK